MSRWDKLMLVAGLCLAILALVRFIVSGVFSPSGIIWIKEFLSPLIGLIVDGRPITAIGPRQYGVVAFLVMDPVIRLFGRDRGAIDAWALAVCLMSIAGAYFLMVKRYFPSHIRDQLFLAAAWLGFLPIIYATALRHIDVWELFFVVLSLFLYTSTTRIKQFSGVPLAAGYLSKLLPILILAYLFFRDRRAAIIGVLSIGFFLALGQALYGTLMGFAYPFVILQQTPGLTTYFSTYHENNSVRGLLFKAFSGFKLSTSDAVSPPFPDVLNAVAWLLQIGLFSYLIFVTVRARKDDSFERKSLEFALAITTMLMIAPETSHEHMPSVIVAYTVLAFFWFKRRSVIPWSNWLAALALIGFVLVGVFVPVAIMTRLLFVVALMVLTGNGTAGIAGNTIGSYDFLGFPGLGLILTWLVLVVLERRFRTSRFV